MAVKIQIDKNIFLYSKTPSNKRIVIFSHSLSDNHKSDLITNISTYLCSKGVNVAVYDFLFAKNEFLPSRGLWKEVEELEFVIRKIKKRLNPEEIILIGKSLGGLVSTIYISKNLNDKVSSAFIVGFPFKLGYPPNFQLLKAEDPVLNGYILEYHCLFKNIKRPVFIIQGDQDDLGEIEECKKFFNNYHNCFLETVIGANHGFVSPKDKNITFYKECSKIVNDKIYKLHKIKQSSSDIL